MLLTVGKSVKDESTNSYALEEVIGQGGFGYVFKACRKKDRAVFAVKTMFPSFSEERTLDVFKDGYGFTLILLESDGLYGDWYVLTNTNSGLALSPRHPEPFAFNLTELQKEINHIKALHIYNTEVNPLNDEVLSQWISELSKRH